MSSPAAKARKTGSTNSPPTSMKRSVRCASSFIARQADAARATATDDAETLATALEDLITSRVDKMSKKVSGAA